MRPTVCVVMIVKNEEARIGRCLRSVVGHADSFVICDTGSTDATISIAESFLRGQDYVIRHDEWVNFGHNRTLAMQEARGRADYLLLLDADMTLLVDEPLPEAWVDAYDLRVLDPTDEGFTYRLPALVSANRPWRSVGATHECLELDGGFESCPFDGWQLVHWCDGARRPVKLTDDLVILQAEHAADPANERTVFYLAQTYKDLGMFDVAIATYEKRAEMGGWQDEVFYSLYQIGCIKTAWWSFAEGAKVFAECFRRFPHRAEPLRAMAYAASHIASTLPVPEGLFVERDAYAR